MDPTHAVAALGKASYGEVKADGGGAPAPADHQADVLRQVGATLRDAADASAVAAGAYVPPAAGSGTDTPETNASLHDTRPWTTGEDPARYQGPVIDFPAEINEHGLPCDGVPHQYAVHFKGTGMMPSETTVVLLGAVAVPYNVPFNKQNPDLQATVAGLMFNGKENPFEQFMPQGPGEPGDLLRTWNPQPEAAAPGRIVFVGSHSLANGAKRGYGRSSSEYWITDGEDFPKEGADTLVGTCALWNDLVYANERAYPPLLQAGYTLLSGAQHIRHYTAWAFSGMARQCTANRSNPADFGAARYYGDIMDWGRVWKVFAGPVLPRGSEFGRFDSSPTRNATTVADPWRYSFGEDGTGEVRIMLPPAVRELYGGIVFYRYSVQVAQPEVAPDIYVGNALSYGTWSRFTAQQASAPVPEFLFVPIAGARAAPGAPPGQGGNTGTPSTDGPGGPGVPPTTQPLAFAPAIVTQRAELTGMVMDTNPSRAGTISKEAVYAGVAMPSGTGVQLVFEAPEGGARDALMPGGLALIVRSGPDDRRSLVIKPGLVSIPPGAAFQILLAGPAIRQRGSFRLSMRDPPGAPVQRQTAPVTVEVGFADFDVDPAAASGHQLLEVTSGTKLDFGNVQPGGVAYRRVTLARSAAAPPTGAIVFSGRAHWSTANVAPMFAFLVEDERGIRQPLDREMEIGHAPLTIVVEFRPTVGAVGGLHGAFTLALDVRSPFSEEHTEETPFAVTAGTVDGTAADSGMVDVPVQPVQQGFFLQRLRQFRDSRAPAQQRRIFLEALLYLFFSPSANHRQKVEDLLLLVQDSVEYSSGSGQRSLQPTVIALRQDLERRVRVPLIRAGVLGSADSGVRFSFANLYAAILHGASDEQRRNVVEGAAATFDGRFETDAMAMETCLELVRACVEVGNQRADARAMELSGQSNYADRPLDGARALSAAIWAIGAIAQGASAFQARYESARRNEQGANSMRVYVSAGIAFAAATPSEVVGEEYVIPRGFITADERAEQIRHYLQDGVQTAVQTLAPYSQDFPLGINLRATAGVYNDLVPLFGLANMPLANVTYPTPGQGGAPGGGAYGEMMNRMPAGMAGREALNPWQQGQVPGVAPEAPAAPAVPEHGIHGHHDLARRPAHWHRPNPLSLELETYRQFWEAYHRDIEAKKEAPVIAESKRAQEQRKRRLHAATASGRVAKQPLRTEMREVAPQPARDAFLDRSLRKTFRLVEGYPFGEGTAAEARMFRDVLL